MIVIAMVLTFWGAGCDTSSSSSSSTSSGGCGTAPTPTPAPADNGTINGTYAIIAVHSGKAMDTWEWGTTNGTNIAQYSYWGGDAQKFNISPVDGVWHRITPVIATDQCVEVIESAIGPGANVQTHTYSGVERQQWRFEDAGSGRYRIINRNSSLCMTVLDSSTDDGANIMQYTCLSDAENQMFELKTINGKFVGNITQSGTIPSDFTTYWNQITCENEGKWASVESTRDSMNWSGIDRAYNFARNNGFPYKQHTFVWGNQYPSWMNNLSASEQREEVEEWIRLYCERYPDTEMIDVVNEPDHATPVWADALGGAGTSGHDWVIWAFEKAREYCPDATLILNDYNVLRWNTDNFVSIANKLKTRGLLDAVGCQAHGLESQSFSELQSNFNKVKGIGVPIYISEYDINLSSDSEQRSVMAQQFPLFYEDSQVAGITLWGYIYGQTWLANSGLVRNGTPRPAMTWLMTYLGK